VYQVENKTLFCLVLLTSMFEVLYMVCVKKKLGAFAETTSVTVPLHRYKKSSGRHKAAPEDP